MRETSELYIMSGQVKKEELCSEANLEMLN